MPTYQRNLDPRGVPEHGNLSRRNQYRGPRDINTIGLSESSDKWNKAPRKNLKNDALQARTLSHISLLYEQDVASPSTQSACKLPTLRYPTFPQTQIAHNAHQFGLNLVQNGGLYTTTHHLRNKKPAHNPAINNPSRNKDHLLPPRSTIDKCTLLWFSSPTEEKPMQQSSGPKTR